MMARFDELKQDNECPICNRITKAGNLVAIVMHDDNTETTTCVDLLCEMRASKRKGDK